MKKKIDKAVKKKPYERHISLLANKDEVRNFELIKTYHSRKSDSDMIRFLINQEVEKIFPKTVPIGASI